MKPRWFFQKFEGGETPSEKTGILVKRKILSKKTPYQKLEVLDTYLYGKVLVLDGIVQTTEKDEFYYHEMMTHLPLIYHGNAKKVLIIGGGDGGTLEEVLKHPVKEVQMVELDREVIEVSKKYLPSICKKAFEDKRSKVIIEDGLKFIKKFRNYFDIVIIDLTDLSSGPSKLLYSPRFYSNVSLALKKDGMVITHSNNFPTMLTTMMRIKKNIRKVFPYVKMHLGIVPAYGGDLFSYTLGSKKSLEIDLKIVQRRFKQLKLHTKYYNPEFHLASGVMPNVLK